MSDEWDQLAQELQHWLIEHRPASWAGFERHLDIDERGVNSRAWERDLGRGGWLSVTWPVEYGGRGLPESAALRVAQELRAAGAPELFNVTGLELVAPAVIHFGTDEQRREVLPALLQGQVWCQGFSEPEAGSDLANIRTRADRTDDGFVVTGQKVWSTNSPIAEYCILLARTNPDAPLHRGLTCFLMSMSLPGVEVRPIHQITGDADFSEIFLTDVVVPRSAVLGEIDAGWQVAIQVLTGERAHPFSLLGTVHDDMMITLEAVRRSPDRAELVRRAAELTADEKVVQWVNDAIVEHVEAGASDPRLESTIKVAWSELHQRIVQLAVEASGLEGLLEADDPDSPLHGHLLWALLHGRAETIYAGTSEIQRNIIAERILGLPREPRADGKGAGRG